MLTFCDRDESGSRRDFLRVGALSRRGGRADDGPGRRCGARAEGRAMPGPDGQVGGLPVPARRAEPVRDVRPEDDRPGRDPQRHRRDPDRASPASRSARRSRSSPSWPTGSAVVRSFVPGDANHDIKPIVGKDTFGANIGRVYASVAGGNHPRDRHADQRRAVPAGRRPATPARADELRQVRRRPARSRVGRRPVPARRRRPAQEDMRLPSAATGSTTAARCSRGSTASRVAWTRPGGRGARRVAAEGVPPAPGRRWPTRSTWRGRTRGRSAGTTPRRWSARRTSTRSGTTTSTTSTTPRRWASCCCWPAGCASAGAGSSRSRRTSSGTCTPT